MRYAWQKNIWTGSHSAIVDENTQLIRLEGGGLYYARQRGSGNTRGYVETTPKKAINSLRAALRPKEVHDGD